MWFEIRKESLNIYQWKWEKEIWLLREDLVRIRNNCEQFKNYYVTSHCMTSLFFDLPYTSCSLCGNREAPEWKKKQFYKSRRNIAFYATFKRRGIVNCKHSRPFPPRRTKGGDATKAGQWYTEPIVGGEHWSKTRRRNQ